MNIYVSNLGFHTSEEDLRKLFEPFGLVSSARVVTDPETTNRVCGYGFVEMDSNAEANLAITNINGKEIEGRCIFINVDGQKETGL